jgi:hypothetical protein
MYFMALFPTIKKYSPDVEFIIIFHKMDPNFDSKKKNIRSKFLDYIESFIQMHEKSVEIYETTIFDLNSIKTAFNQVL